MRTLEEIFNEYDLIKNKTLRLTRLTIEDLHDTDKYTEDRVRIVDYADRTSWDNKEKFFYEALRTLMFTKEDAVAYTTPQKTIVLCYPNTEMVPIDGDRFKRWYFIYCHECLHQLWDTFAVEKDIIKKYKSCNHKILNIAADCVINDYLDKIAKKGKMKPTGGIFPNILKEEFGIPYNSRTDTQFSLYEKIMGLSEDKLEELLKLGEETLEPKSITQIKKGGSGEPQPPQIPDKPMPRDYVRGWTQCIIDVQKKKFDPLKDYSSWYNDNYKEESKLFSDGYAECVETIKKGLEEGIQVMQSENPPSSDGNTLPQIPWNIPDNMKPKGGSSGEDTDSNDSSANSSMNDVAEAAQQAADVAKEAAETANKIAETAEANNLDNADKVKESAQQAADAAKAAQQAADAAKAAAASGNIDDVIKETMKAAKAAADASDALNSAKSDASKEILKPTNSDDGEADGKSDGKTTDDAFDDSDDRSNSGNNGNNGDSGEEKTPSNSEVENINKQVQTTSDKLKEARDALKKAIEKAQASQKNNGNTEANGGGRDKNMPGQGNGDRNNHSIEIAKLMEANKSVMEGICSKYRNSITGPLGLFIQKSKSSKALQSEGLAVKARKGNSDWDKELEAIVNTYMHNRVKSLTKWKKDWGRLRYGEMGFTRQDLKNGREFHPDRKRRKQNITIEVSVYVDISTSMTSKIDKVFKATYGIVNDLIQTYGGSDKGVEEIKPNMYVFNEHIKKITWGKTHPVTGGNDTFEYLLDEIYKRSADSFLNIIITDGGYSGTDNDEVADVLNKMEGMFVLVTDNPPGTWDATEKVVNAKCGPDKFVAVDAIFD